TGAAVSSDAARIGSAAFLAPATRTSPESGTPPRMESFCIRCLCWGPRGPGFRSARRPLFRGIGLHGKRVDLLAHAIAERRIDELVLAHAREAGELRAHDHRLEVRAVAPDLEVGHGEAIADGLLDGAGFDHVRVPPRS